MRYTLGERCLGMNVWLGDAVDAPHLTAFVSVSNGSGNKGNGGTSAILMADHLPRYDLANRPEYVRRYYGNEMAVRRWSNARHGPGILPFVSADPAVRAIQGPNALALRADCSTRRDDDDDDDGDGAAGLTILVEALNDHCSSWLEHARNAHALTPEERGMVVERDMAMRRCLRDHERDAGKRVMDPDFAMFLADCMAGFI